MWNRNGIGLRRSTQVHRQCELQHTGGRLADLGKITVLGSLDLSIAVRLSYVAVIRVIHYLEPLRTMLAATAVHAHPLPPPPRHPVRLLRRGREGRQRDRLGGTGGVDALHVPGLVHRADRAAAPRHRAAAARPEPAGLLQPAGEAMPVGEFTRKREKPRPSG